MVAASVIGSVVMGTAAAAAADAGKTAQKVAAEKAKSQQDELDAQLGNVRLECSWCRSIVTPKMLKCPGCGAPVPI